MAGRVEIPNILLSKTHPDERDDKTETRENQAIQFVTPRRPTGKCWTPEGGWTEADFSRRGPVLNSPDVDDEGTISVPVLPRVILHLGRSVAVPVLPSTQTHLQQNYKVPSQTRKFLIAFWPPRD